MDVYLLYTAAVVVVVRRVAFPFLSNKVVIRSNKIPFRRVESNKIGTSRRKGVQRRASCFIGAMLVGMLIECPMDPLLFLRTDCYVMAGGCTRAQMAGL